MWQTHEASWEGQRGCHGDTDSASNRDKQPQVTVQSEVHGEGKKEMQLQACLNGSTHPLYKYNGQRMDNIQKLKNTHSFDAHNMT